MLRPNGAYFFSGLFFFPYHANAVSTTVVSCSRREMLAQWEWHSLKVCCI